MVRQRMGRLVWPGLIFVVLVIGLAAGCGSSEATSPAEAANQPLLLPAVGAMTSSSEKLQVLATTSIIGDVVRQVGGEAIDLTVLMQPGQDPHSYQPGAADLTAAADAGVIFVNGWNLEEGLVDDLAAIGGEAVIIPVSAGIQPLELDDTESEHGPIDPHTWQDVANVIAWVENIRLVLGTADPANAALYDANAAAYRTTLEELDASLRETLATIPAERRILVTNHDNLGYFAAAYGFDVVATVIPSISTLAEPSAGALAELVRIMESEGICTLVLESATSDQLARTLENELTGCEGIQIVALYTDALGPAGSGAESYVGMMRNNAAALVEGLR